MCLCWKARRFPSRKWASTTRTLESPDVDKALARKELKESPLYNDLLVSPDLKTTAILITFPNDLHYENLVERRNALHEKRASGSLTPAEQVELKIVARQFAQYHDKVRQQRHDDIIAIRADNGPLSPGRRLVSWRDEHDSRRHDKLHQKRPAGFRDRGIPAAGAHYRELSSAEPTGSSCPLLTCLVSVACTVGIPGLVRLGSNGHQFQLHLPSTDHYAGHDHPPDGRYRELAAEQPQACQHELILSTIQTMWRPCVYSGLTTMMGFASLIFCNIRPIINFGYIMVVGVAISIIVPFLLLPAVLVLMPRDKPWSKRKSRWSLTPMLGRFTMAHGTLIIVASAVLLFVNIVGNTQTSGGKLFYQLLQIDHRNTPGDEGPGPAARRDHASRCGH